MDADADPTTIRARIVSTCEAAAATANEMRLEPDHGASLEFWRDQLWWVQGLAAATAELAGDGPDPAAARAYEHLRGFRDAVSAARGTLQDADPVAATYAAARWLVAAAAALARTLADPLLPGFLIARRAPTFEPQHPDRQLVRGRVVAAFDLFRSTIAGRDKRATERASRRAFLVGLVARAAYPLLWYAGVGGEVLRLHEHALLSTSAGLEHQNIRWRRDTLLQLGSTDSPLHSSG